MPLDFVTILLYFPLLLPIWQERPITYEDLVPAPYVTAVSDELIAKQSEALGLVDAEMRARVLTYLHRTRHAKAGDMLHHQLAGETSVEVIATVLEQLCLFKTEAGMAAEVTPFLSHRDTAVRVAAVRLYGRLPVVKLAPVEALAVHDAQERVRMTAWQVLGENPTRCSPAFLREHWADTDGRIRAVTFGASLVLPDALSSRQTFLTACADTDVNVRLALATRLATAPPEMAGELCRKLSRDAFASVRVLAAQAVPKLGYTELLPLLLELADDRDPEVRRVALVSLAGSGAPTAVEKAVAHLGDSSVQAHNQAEETAVALHKQADAVAATAARIEDPDPIVRFHVFRILGRLGAKQYVPVLVQHMNGEKLPANIAAAIFALAELRASETVAEVLKFQGFGLDDDDNIVQARKRGDDELGRLAADPAKQESARQALASEMARLTAERDGRVGVRVEVAHALGMMAVPESYPRLEVLVFDKAALVRISALLAVGRLADGHFNPTLLRVLQSVGPKDGISGRDRNLACWAAGRTRPIGMEVMKRLVVQATTPVIPTDFGPIFEDESVLISCDFALAQCARELPAVKPLAEQVMNFHSRPPGNGPIGIGSLTPTPELIEYSRQARGFMNKQEVKPGLRPTQDIFLPYRPMRPPVP